MMEGIIDGFICTVFILSMLGIGFLICLFLEYIVKGLTYLFTVLLKRRFCICNTFFKYKVILCFKPLKHGICQSCNKSKKFFKLLETVDKW